jgi:hypothetical protein
MCGGVGILDYDGDGLMDIFFTNGAKLPELEKSDPSFYHCLLRNRAMTPSKTSPPKQAFPANISASATASPLPTTTTTDGLTSSSQTQAGTPSIAATETAPSPM